MLRSSRPDHRDAVGHLAVGRSWGSAGPAKTVAERLSRYELLASAIAGHPVGVASVEPGEPAWTDGATVFIAAGETARSQVAALTVQSALLGAGSLDADVLATLVRRPTLARRYLAIEGHRALSVGEHLLPRSVRGLIDRSIARRTNSPSESLGIARSRQALDEPPDIFGTIRPRRVEMTAARLREKDAASEHVPRRSGDLQLSGDDAGDDDSGPDVDAFSSPIGGGGGIGSWFKRLFSEGRSAGGGPPGADSPTRWSSRGDRFARASGALDGTSPDFRSHRVARASGGHLSRVGRAQEALQTGLVHGRGGRADTGRARSIRATRHTCAAPTAGSSRHRSRAPSPSDAGRRRRPRRGGRGPRAAEGRVGAGRIGLHRQPEKTAGSLGAAAARHLRISRRTECNRRAVHEHQRGVAAALTLALHDLGDRVALYGFRSQGRSAVQIVPVKRFGDDPDALGDAASRRIGPRRVHARLGAAIRHGTAVLEREGGTSRRLLVVLSDGLAYDHGYERAYGEADSRRALSEARRRGIGTLCLSVGAGTDVAVLRRIFGVAAHASLSRSEQLPAVVGPLFRSALRSAELQRSASQRRERTKERLDVEGRTA